MAKFFFSRQAKNVLWLLLLLPAVRIFAQPVVVDFGTTNTFTANAAATNFSWTLDGTGVGGDSNSFAYTPQVYDVGTHYLLVNQTFPGAVNSNSYWDVRVRIALPASGTNYYVATNGSDTNAGTLGAPFLTLEKARNTIRALARPLPAGGVTVWLRGGTFYRTNTLMLTNANDSGMATAPVVWRSFSNETAVVSGGTSIPAAGWVPLSSSQTNRVAPGVNPTNIWELDLASAGITHATNFPADFNQWTTFNTYNQSVDGGLCELIYNGQRQFLSRYPNHNLTNDDLLTTNMLMDGVANGLVNAGTTLIYSGDSTNSLNYPGTYTNSSGAAIPVGGAFLCKTNDIARFTRWQSAITNGGLWLQGYWRVSWQIDGVSVIGFDVTNRTVMLNTNAHPGNGIGNKYNRPAGSKVEPYWALNLLEEMDQPGEWAADFSRKKIYFYAPGPLTNGSVVISDFGSPLVQIGGAAGVVSNVVFQSVNFEAALAQTILITNAMNNLVLGCNFNNINNYAVDINGGGTNGVVSCNLQNLAAGGVLLRGGTANFNQTLRVPARDFVVNNVITNFARVVRVYAAAVDAGFGGAGGSGGGGGDTTCVGMRIAHNNMSVSPHGVVLFGSWDTTHEYNELSHYQQVSDDLGGFYSDDLISRHGNQIFRYNFMHNTPLGNGIDYDGDHYLMQHYGNIINLNTIPSESQGIGIRYQTASQATSGNEQSAVCYNNLIANGHLGSSFVALLPSVIEENAATFCTTPFSWQQVVVGATNNTIVTVSQSTMQSGPNTNYVADPGFLSLTNNDMRLNPASRIYSDMPKFQQIPVEMIGLYNDEFRTNAAGWSPFITTSNAVNVTPTNAVCDGKLFFPQFDANTTVMVYYGLTDGGSNALAWQNSTNIGIFSAGNLSAQVSGLQPNTNYYFRFFATNAFGSSWSASSSSLVTPPPPPFTTFTNLTPNQTVLANAFVSLSGQVFNTAPLYPTNGEIISVTINGVTQTTYTTNNNGSFSLLFNATNIPVATGGYAITYAYAGSTNLSGTTNTSTALSIVPSSFAWNGASGTNFETGGIGGNWSDYAAPINDAVSSTAIFGNPPTTNLPSLTTSRSVAGLSFSSTNGGWTLGSGAPNYILSLGANGITTAGQTSGTNLISANLNLGANQTWQVGAGGTLLFTGSVTIAAANTNYSIAFNSGGNTGTVILSPSAGNKIFLTGSNNTASIFQVKSGGVLQLGGDGVNAPATASTNQIFNTATNTFGAFAINAPGKVKMNSGYWIFTDLGKNGSDKLTGTLEVDGGTVSFGGGRYLGEGTIQVNGGALKFGSDAMTHFINGGRFSLGNFYTVQTNVAVMNITGGFVDLAQANGSVGNGNGIGYGVSTLLNQSGGVLQNGVTPGTGGTTTSFSIGGLNGTGNGTTNNLSAFTLTGGTFISAGVVAASTNAGPGSVNNFNFMGGVLAVQSFNATNLGSSPTATVFANQTNVSWALGTLANYGGALAPGNLGVPGKTFIFGNYAVSNNAAVLAIDIGGTNQANAFQNGATNYDSVSVAGSVTLGGNLNVNLINTFVPAATNSFTILTNAGTMSGNFTNIVGGRVAVTNLAGGSFAVLTGTKSVVLTNFVLLQANFTASALTGAVPLSVTFTDTSTGLITNRFWDFGDGFTTNTTATTVVHTFNSTATNLVLLVVSDAMGSSTNALNIAVSSPTAPPLLGIIGVAGTNFIISGTNGTSGGYFYLLATTNLYLSMTNWSVVATNQFGPGGGFNFTSPISAGQNYYRLRLP